MVAAIDSKSILERGAGSSPVSGTMDNQIPKKQKIIVITGPTATGKSALGIELAKAFSGEIISADSRQVYRGLDIGSAKVTESKMEDIPHHMIDVADPTNVFTVAEFQKMAREKMRSIFSRGNVPMIVGGTGMYISAIIDNIAFPEVPPNYQLRKSLESVSPGELLGILRDLDPRRANSIDPDNPVRLIRSIEIATAIGKVPNLPPRDSDHEVLMIGLELPKEELVSRIEQRIDDRIPALFDEIKKLLSQGVPADRLRSFGLEYRYGTDYAEGIISLDEFKKTLATKTWQFVRRQMTWWKRDSRVIWTNPVADHQKILDLVQEFLSE